MNLNLKWLKVAFSGSFSTWKTTIINLFKSNWYPIIEETSRRVLNWRNINNLSESELNLFQKELIELQIHDEELFTQNNKWFIIDTALLDTLAYSQNLATKDELFKLVEDNYKGYDIIFYFPLLDEIEDDNQRHTSREFQENIDSLIRWIYKEKNIEYVEVPLYKELNKEDSIKRRYLFIENYILNKVLEKISIPECSVVSNLYNIMKK